MLISKYANLHKKIWFAETEYIDKFVKLKTSIVGYQGIIASNRENIKVGPVWLSLGLF